MEGLQRSLSHISKDTAACGFRADTQNAQLKGQLFMACHTGGWQYILSLNFYSPQRVLWENNQTSVVTKNLDYYT